MQHIVDSSALPVHWHKSSRSNNSSACVEVAANLAAARGVVVVRDSKDPAGPALTVTPQAWTGFLASITAGAGSMP